MTENDDAVRQLKIQLREEVLLPLQTLLNLTGGVSSIQQPNPTPLLELIEQKFMQIIDD